MVFGWDSNGQDMNLGDPKKGIFEKGWRILERDSWLGKCWKHIRGWVFVSNFGESRETKRGYP